MEKNEAVPSEPAHRRRHRSHPRSEKPEKPKKKVPGELNFFQRYWVEILGVSLLSLGIFLLIEKLQIRSILYGKLVWLVQVLGRFFASLAEWCRELEISDVIGLLLVFGALFIIGLRVRTRMIARHADLGSFDKCPKCGKSMSRVPSSLGHRLLAFVMQVRIKRFACQKCPGRGTVWERKLPAQKWA